MSKSYSIYFAAHLFIDQYRSLYPLLRRTFVTAINMILILGLIMDNFVSFNFHDEISTVKFLIK
jgi:hypothetical protein